jgi:hypothetical protein
MRHVYPKARSTRVLLDTRVSARPSVSPPEAIATPVELAATLTPASTAATPPLTSVALAAAMTPISTGSFRLPLSAAGAARRLGPSPGLARGHGTAGPLAASSSSAPPRPTLTVPR